MLKTRVMPCLLLRRGALVKTVKFRDPRYVGDPVNTVRIFNEKEVDELIFLDIEASTEGREPLYELLSDIAVECFMPFAYGGGIRSLDQVERLNQLGIEKICLNTIAFERPEFVSAVADRIGSQSTVASIDVKRTFLGKSAVHVRSGRKNTSLDPVRHAVDMARRGAGEILLTSIDRDGTFDGYDVGLIGSVTREVDIPVVACGGARTVRDFGEAVRHGGAAAAAAGSMFVYQGPNRAVLINFPTRDELSEVLD